MERALRVIIAADQPRANHSLRALFASLPASALAGRWTGLDLVGDATSGTEAATLSAEIHPDTVLLDLRIPDAVAATHQIKGRHPRTRVVALTLHSDARATLLAAGVDAFVLKGSPIGELLDALAGSSRSLHHLSSHLHQVLDTGGVRMYREIMVPLDGSSFAEAALPLATRLANTTGARLTLVRVVPNATKQERGEPELAEPTISGLIAEDLAINGPTIRAAKETQVYLDRIAATAAQSGARVETTAPNGTVEECLLREIKRRHIELVVMSTHGRSGVGRWVYGSVAESLLAYCPAPMVLVRPDKAGAEMVSGNDRAPIVVPLDGTVFSEDILPAAAELASSLQSPMMLVHVVDPSHLAYCNPLTGDPTWIDREGELLQSGRLSGERYLGSVADQLRLDGVEVETKVVLGSPAAMIRETAHNAGAQVIAMSMHGGGPLRTALFGSVSHAVLRHSPLALLVARPGEHTAFPVEFQRRPADAIVEENIGR